MLEPLYTAGKGFVQIKTSEDYDHLLGVPIQTTEASFPSQYRNQHQQSRWTGSCLHLSPSPSEERRNKYPLVQNMDCAAPVCGEIIIWQFGIHHVHHGGEEIAIDGFPIFL